VGSAHADIKSNDSKNRLGGRRLSSLKSSLQRALGTVTARGEMPEPICEGPSSPEDLALLLSSPTRAPKGDNDEIVPADGNATMLGSTVEPAFVPPSPSSEMTTSNEVEQNQGIDAASIVFTEEHSLSHPVLQERISNSEAKEETEANVKVKSGLFAAFAWNLSSSEGQ
jgi:hypothetical protein